jgi:hypothetical protein
MQEQISSSFMESPPPPLPLPHLDGPFFGADLLPSARLRRMRGYRPAPGGLEEEVRYTTPVLQLAVNSKHTALVYRIALASLHPASYAFPPSACVQWRIRLVRDYVAMRFPCVDTSLIHGVI